MTRYCIIGTQAKLPITVLGFPFTGVAAAVWIVPRNLRSMKRIPVEKLNKRDIASLAASTGNAAGFDLAGISLSNMELIGIRFDGSNLKGADLSSANLSGTSFDSCDLTG
ncbi:MAG TPA: pentapeptide repeat-containing protein, partial [Nitrospirota bacterium]|nr:pentapeptide repeat-containing protein [Nitrospirota bacterium]